MRKIVEFVEQVRRTCEISPAVFSPPVTHDENDANQVEIGMREWLKGMNYLVDWENIPAFRPIIIATVPSAV